ncbi:hypothetical protein [Nocardia sp. CC227C]|uniref:hypothetical protein n=1 Tax=Nocardia sp. CC227C TaxID=3044562 RepID=UPI00278C3153|nr:hypothetical protein [Nocardia sp. CC227C]
MLHGEQGSEGPEGPAGTPFRWQGDVSDHAALTAIIPTLNSAMFGFAFRVLSDNSVMFWDGTKFVAFLDAFGGIGLTGEVNTLSIGTVTTGNVGDPLVVSITGTPPNQTLNLTVPRGPQGQKGLDGPPGPLVDSTDWDDSVTLVDGMVPLWSEDTSLWTPTQWPGFRGPWSVVEGQSWDNPTSGFIADQTNIGTNPLTLATINIPAQPIRWRPYVAGGVTLRSVPTDFNTRVDVEVRIGSAAGDLVGRGVGSSVYIDRYRRLRPFFASSFSAGSTTGTIAPDTATTLYVVARRNQGSGNYSYTRSNAQIIVWAHPSEAP